MNRRQQRKAITISLEDLRSRVEKLRAHRARPDYSQLTDEELRLLTELSRKAHGDLLLDGIDLLATGRSPQGMGCGQIQMLANQPFDLSRLNEPEQAEYARLIARIQTLPL